jgi:hypothetical protein
MGAELFIQEGDLHDYQVRSETTIYAFFETEEDARIYLERHWAECLRRGDF